MVFAVTGFTLNHADIFETASDSEIREYTLTTEMVDRLGQVKGGDTVPPDIAAIIEQEVGVDLSGEAVDNQYGEISFALDRPGRDVKLTIDLNAGEVYSEEINRGAIGLLNDLHKGRHAGLVWGALIDLSALVFIIFAVTGLGLLLLQQRMRTSTLPLTSLGVVVPAIVYLLFVH